MSEQMTIAFPHLGDYHVPIRKAFQAVFPQARVISAPPMTRETAALGARYSPDFVCAPFKFCIGNFIQALEAGANVLCQTGTGCRFGYFGELQQQILTDLGYEFQFLNLNRDKAAPDRIYRELKAFGSPLSPAAMAHQVLVAEEAIRAMDVLARYIRENLAFSPEPTAMEAVYTGFLRDLEGAESVAAVRALRHRAWRQLTRQPVERPAEPIRVGIVGDLYTVMEPFSNFGVERRLARRHIAVSRKMSLTFLLLGRPSGPGALRQAGGYLQNKVGANGLDSVAQSRRYARKGYDGIIQLKSFGCIPELNAAPALMGISRDYEIPVMQMSFDTHSAEAGVETRLEAFMDMLEMRRRGSGVNV